MQFRKQPTLNKITFGILINIYFFLPGCGSNPSAKIDCSRFKMGQFLFRYKGPNGIINFSLIRNGKIQTEINRNTGDTAKYKIIWLNECNYNLKFLKSTEVLPEGELQLRKTMTIKTSILKTTNDYYIFQTKSDKSEYVMKDTMWIKK